MMEMIQLTDASDDQTALGKAILTRIFVDQDRHIRLEADQLGLTAAMIVAAESSVARVMVQALDVPTVVEMASFLFDAHGGRWLEWVDQSVLVMVFQGLNVPLQRRLLEWLHHDGSRLYDVLRAKTSNSMIRVGATFVTKAKAGAMIETRVDRVIQLIKDDAIAPAEFDEVSASIRRDFDWDDVVGVVEGVIAEFRQLAIPLASAADFKAHLKVHWLLAKLPRSFSMESRRPLDRLVADSVYRMPDMTWVLKVLNQYPKESIGAVLAVIASDQLSADSAVRNRAVRLLNDLRSVDMADFENVRWALQSMPLQKERS
ncbi:hypothetical protein EBR57_04950 [bacterium]|nr:hypothetical protein [bacterium]